MPTSLAVPVAYITVLITALAIFSRVYRRRRLVEKTSFEPWFPIHPTRDIYISLLQAEPSVPDSLLKSALLVRAQADVKRIWRLRDDKAALTILHAKGSVGDDTMARFAAAEKELEAEIVDVVSEANTFRQGWGQMIFATASEMAMAEKTRDLVMSIPKIKAAEDKRLSLRAKYLPNQPLMGPPATSTTAAGIMIDPTIEPKGLKAPPHVVERLLREQAEQQQRLAQAAVAVAAKTEVGSGTSTPNTVSAPATPAKTTPSKKKGKKK